MKPTWMRPRAGWRSYQITTQIGVNTTKASPIVASHARSNQARQSVPDSTCSFLIADMVKQS